MRREFKRLLSLAIHRERVGKHLFHLVAFRVGQGGTHGIRVACVLIPLHVHIQLERSILVLVVEVGGDKPVKQAGLRRGIECHIVENTSQAPIVLTLQVVAITIFQHADGQRVLAWVFSIRRKICCPFHAEGMVNVFR